MRFLEAYDLQLYARARVVSYSLKVMASSKLFLPFRGKKLTFGPDKQSDAAHAKEVAQLREKPPTDAFDACLPQNKRPNAGSNLAPDGCHKDSDRVDVDGLPKVGVAVWPGQTFCSMVCL